MTDFRVLVFAYDFPHVKSEQILVGLKLHDVTVASVIGAPKVKLNKTALKNDFASLPLGRPAETSTCCRALGFDYVVSRHDDSDRLAAIVAETGANIGVIAGARILKSAVIDLFEYGIVNYHPGKIPETSGLDSLYWTIANDAPAGVTTHFIDPRVDAGQLLSFDEIAVDAADTLASISHKIFVRQLDSHRDVCTWLAAGEMPAYQPLDRPTKNEPMTSEQRRAAIDQFPDWRARQVNRVG